MENRIVFVIALCREVMKLQQLINIIKSFKQLNLRKKKKKGIWVEIFNF